MIFEIRNYHFDPARFEDYRKWARERALPFLNAELDLVGFWTNTADEAEVLGEPHDALGTANITWILRWADRETRDRRMAEVFASPAWAEIFRDVPGGLDSYLRRESKFADAL